MSVRRARLDSAVRLTALLVVDYALLRVGPSRPATWKWLALLGIAVLATVGIATGLR